MIFPKTTTNSFVDATVEHTPYAAWAEEDQAKKTPQSVYVLIDELLPDFLSSLQRTVTCRLRH